MCPKIGRHFNCSQQCYGPYPEYSGSLQVESPSRYQTDKWKVPFWSQTNWIPRHNHFIRRVITTNSQKSKLLEQIEIPQITKSFTRMAENFNPFYKLLEPELPVNITSELKKRFVLVREALSDPCELALKQPILGKQLVLLTDASFRSADFALLIEDNPDQYTQSKRKTLPWRLDQEFHPCTTQDVHPLQRIHGNLHGIYRVRALFVGGIKTNDCRNGQHICHPFVSNKNHPTNFVEPMRLCAPVQFQDSTHRCSGKHISCHSLHTGAESHGEDPSQNPGGCKNNTNRGDILLGCCRWR